MTTASVPGALRNIPVVAIERTRLNPRGEEEDDELEGLRASLGAGTTPKIIQPPVVEEYAPGKFRLIAGERRLTAAARGGWDTIECIVRPLLDPVEAQTMRVLENMHRRGVNPINEAAGLMTLYLCAQAEALERGDAARKILNAAPSLTKAVDRLQRLVNEAGFQPKRPPVTWNDFLDRLGIAMSSASRKRLLNLLKLDPKARDQARETNMTEAALRAVGTLVPEQQSQLVEAIRKDPQLASRARRIAHAVRDLKYTLADAVAEAKGQTVEIMPAASDPEVVDDGVSQAVMRCLEASTALTESLSALHQVSTHGVSGLGAPWNTWLIEMRANLLADLQWLEPGG